MTTSLTKFFFFFQGTQTVLPAYRATTWFKDRGQSLYFKVGPFFSLEVSAWKLDCRPRHRTQQEQSYLARMKSVSWEAATRSVLPAADTVLLYRVQYVFRCSWYIRDLGLLMGLHFHELIAYSANPSQYCGARAHRACQLNLFILFPEACCAIFTQSQMRCDEVQYIIIRCGRDWQQSVLIK